MPWPKMPFPTRMTVIRLEGGLVVHSPTALTADLEAEIELLGPPRWIVGPNRIHYWWIPEWREAFPNAEVWRSEEHTSEIQSLMRLSYAVFCLKKKKQQYNNNIIKCCISLHSLNELRTH